MKVGGGAGAAPSSVEVDGRTVTLTLATAVPAVQTVTVSYTVPSSNPVQDESGLDAPALRTSASGPLVLTVEAVKETEGEGEPVRYRIVMSRRTPGAVVESVYGYRGDFVRNAPSSVVTGIRSRKGRRLYWEVARATLDDAVVEADGSFTVSLRQGFGYAHGQSYTVGTPSSATVTILDNDGGAPPPVSPPVISVADARVREGPGAALAFSVRLDRAAVETATVDWETLDGSAKAGRDYTAASGTLIFAPGETAKTVRVAVLDDSHHEGKEKMLLYLRNAEGAVLGDALAAGTIENNDGMPHAWIARFGRTVADQVVEAVDTRLRAARTAGASVSLAGRRIGLTVPEAGTAAKADAEEEARLKALSGWLKQETEEERSEGFSRTLSGREMLMGSSFSLAAGTEDGGGFAALWGRMGQTRFAGREGTLSLDGDVTTGLLGADYASGRWTTGLVVSHSIGEGGYRDEGSGDIEASVTALTPWAGYAVTERLSVWGAAGYGEGELTLTPGDDAALKTDLGMALAAAGARGALIDGEGPRLDAVTDARWVRTTTARVSSAAGNLASASASVTRLRLGLESSWPLALDEETFGTGAAVTPRLALGVRHDGGDAETGFGADIGGGVTLASPARGLTVSLEGRGVLTHEASGLRARGLAGTVSWNPPPAGRGPRLTLTQSVGASATGGMGALLGRDTLEGLAANDDGAGRRRLEARFGYGIGTFDNRFTMTPELGLGLSPAGRDYSLGWRLARSGSGPGSLELSLQARRRESANDDVPPEHGIGFAVTARW